MAFMVKMALRSLVFRRRQFSSLFFVCVFGAGVSLASLFLCRGMNAALREKARVYFGGDYVVSGGTSALSIPDAKRITELVRDAFPDGSVVSERFNMLAWSSSLFFDGTEAHVRVINGIDFDSETALLSTMNFSAGGFFSSGEMMARHGILLSRPVSEKLGCTVGSRVTFLTRLPSGFLNTVEFEVTGIFSDSSIFGMYTAYADKSVLMESCGMESGWANRICVQLPEGKTADVEAIREKLSEKIEMFPIVSDKNEFYDMLGSFSVETFAIFPLDAYLGDVEIMEVAMDGVTMFVIIVLVVIVVVGIGSSYKVIVMKRINEIGVYMAIGMGKAAVTGVLSLEAFFLLVAGCAGGLAFSGVICAVMRLFDFSFVPSFDIFLSDGCLNFSFDMLGCAAVIAAVVFVTLLVVVQSVWKSVRIMPVDALANME
ncbi:MULTISPECIES: ABC transporter permease [Treponema]|uniref:Uncharacterized protein n=1 Tax=Treponema saccharophilum DSM 2985 TaxID=907348 RepID=H7EPI9_9SPIR|nr:MULTISPECIES: ABC transporter permease [Treponema]EIC00390.1 protein of unknown function DUF214 [Treponema saccharophilum DSM 2985]MBQ5537917.1 ABC transporter permease [Treponema sp.]BDC94926.1 hypothetical protein TRSA_00250 [Treponema saccharophilum]